MSIVAGVAAGIAGYLGLVAVGPDDHLNTARNIIAFCAAVALGIAVWSALEAPQP